MDLAGVRVDDSARRRLESQLSGWVLGMFVVGFTIVSLFAIFAVAPLGVARARAARVPGAGEIDPDSRRRAFYIALALAPFALAALAAGALALFRV